MAETPSIIQHPSGYMWGAAVRAAARHRFKFSSGAKAVSRRCSNRVSKPTKSDLYEFAERKAEAQGNIEKLVRAMINAQLTKDPAVDILDEWTISHVLYDEKMCPGLWPIC